MIMIGAAYQIGALPISAVAIEHAITINGVAVDNNIAAFRQGRWAMVTGPASPVDPDRLNNATADEVGSGATDLDELVAIRVAELTSYQNAAYAADYAAFVETVRAQEERSVGGTELAAAVARNLFKLMAYKDEYEVARLSLDPALLAQVEAQFGAGARVDYRLHPPVLRALGMRNKISLGPWFRPGFRVLRQMRRLRGTALDLFGYTEVRRVERALPDEYRAWMARVLPSLTAENHPIAVQIAELPDLVRGYEQIKMRSVDTYRRRAEELLAEVAAPDVDGARKPHGRL
jgi:indolepyruvate ferredoxin oxidoreductase